MIGLLAKILGHPLKLLGDLGGGALLPDRTVIISKDKKRRKKKYAAGNGKKSRGVSSLLFFLLIDAVSVLVTQFLGMDPSISLLRMFRGLKAGSCRMRSSTAKRWLP